MTTTTAQVVGADHERNDNLDSQETPPEGTHENGGIDLIDDAGMATAEYAMVTVAAAAFAAVLIALVRSPEVRELLLGIFLDALQMR